jgi:hypothetical protein
MREAVRDAETVRIAMQTLSKRLGFAKTAAA